MILYWSAASDAANQISDSRWETFACDATSPIWKAIENMLRVQLSVSIFKEKLPSAQTAPQHFANLGCEPYCHFCCCCFLNRQQPLAWTFPAFKSGAPTLRRVTLVTASIKLLGRATFAAAAAGELKTWALLRHSEEQTLKSNLNLAWTITNLCWSILKLL